MTGRTFTWRVAAGDRDAAEMVLTASTDGLVTLAAEPAGPAKLDNYQRAALAAALDAADRAASGLRARLQPDGRGHASAAAEHLLTLVVATDPSFRVTAEMHDAATALVHAVAAALCSTRGGDQ